MTATALQLTTVVIVAGHALVRAGLRSLLDATPGFSVVGETAHLDGAAAIAAHARPDLILLGVPPRDSEEKAAVAELREIAPTACVLCLDDPAIESPDDVPCVPARSSVAEFCSVVGTVLGERCGACALRATCIMPSMPLALPVALSRRERQVAVAVARGLSSKQIAAALGIGLRTVNTYRESLARKIGGSSAAILTRYVLENNLTG